MGEVNEEEDMDKIDIGDWKKDWTEDEDERLRELYEIFSNDMETCIPKLASAFDWEEWDISLRLKKLKIRQWGGLEEEVKVEDHNTVIQ